MKIQYVIYSHVAIDEIQLPDGEHRPATLGGAGAYAAAGAALAAGVGEVGIISGIGEDFGTEHRTWLAESGIDASGLVVTDPNTPRTQVEYHDDGERTETPVYGCEHFDRAAPTVTGQLDSYSVPAGIYVFLRPDEDLWEQLDRLREPRVRRSQCLLWEVDAAACTTKALQRVTDRATDVDVLSINRTEIQSLCNEADLDACLETLHAAGVPVIVLRLGSAGALVSTPSGLWRATPAPGTVLDPTGAGNAFSGAFMVAWTQTGDPEAALRAGMAAAALTLEDFGPPVADGPTRARFRRLAHSIEVRSAHGRHRQVGPEGELKPMGRSVADLNQGALARFPYVENIPLRGFLIGGRPALTRIDPSLIGDYVLITVRDPLCDYEEDPAQQIATHLDDAVLAGRSSMFTTYSGTYKGVRISVVSGGSGGPEAELALHELFEYTDATTFVRVGGSGGMHPSVRPGDLVIASGVVRDEGLTASYIPLSYPGACAPEVVLALAQAAFDSGYPYHVGTTRSADSDYVGGGRPSVAGYFQPWHIDLAETWVKAGVLNGDRESAAIVTLARLFGRRGGSICSVADNLSTGEPFNNGDGHTSAIGVALEGMVVLAEMDRQRQAAGAPIWLPRLDVRGTER